LAAAADFLATTGFFAATFFAFGLAAVFLLDANTLALFCLITSSRDMLTVSG